MTLTSTSVLRGQLVGNGDAANSLHLASIVLKLTRSLNDQKQKRTPFISVSLLLILISAHFLLTFTNEQVAQRDCIHGFQPLLSHPPWQAHSFCRKTIKGHRVSIGFENKRSLQFYPSQWELNHFFPYSILYYSFLSSSSAGGPIVCCSGWWKEMKRGKRIRRRGISAGWPQGCCLEKSVT